MKITFKRPKKKPVARKKLDGGRILISTVGILSLVVTIVALCIKEPLTEYLTNFANTEISAFAFEVTDNIHYVGSNEAIVIKALPNTGDSTVALLRLEVSNAKVVGFTPDSDLIMAGACDNGESYTDNSLCVDLATTKTFSYGQELGTMDVVWLSGADSTISVASGNGYYNGKELYTLAIEPLTVAIWSELPATGSDRSYNCHDSGVVCPSTGAYEGYSCWLSGYCCKWGLPPSCLGSLPTTTNTTETNTTNADTTGTDKTATAFVNYCANDFWTAYYETPNTFCNVASGWYCFNNRGAYYCGDSTLQACSACANGCEPNSTNHSVVCTDGLNVVTTLTVTPVEAPTTETGDSGSTAASITWDCAKSAYISKQYKTCSNGNLYWCDSGTPKEQECGDGCTSNPSGTDDTCGETTASSASSSTSSGTSSTSSSSESSSSTSTKTVTAASTWNCSNSSYNGTQYKTCSDGNLHWCESSVAKETDCANGCTTNGSGTDDVCTGTISTTSGKMACGTKKCEYDSDCETGLPDYECDEDTTDWPNNNICVILCDSNQTREGYCSCVDKVGVTCGKIDVDGNGILNYIDLAAFAAVYNKTCTDTAPTAGCGGKDTNKDGKINYVDLQSFTSRYHTVSNDCSK